MSFLESVCSAASALAFCWRGATPSQRPQRDRQSADSRRSPRPPFPLLSHSRSPRSPPPQTQHNSACSSSSSRSRRPTPADEADYRKGQLAGSQGRVRSRRRPDAHQRHRHQERPQLQDEFDRIVDQVNALEMEALKQGNGFAPKEEPSPADVASDVTFEGRSQHRGQGQDRAGHHQVRPAAHGQRLRGRLHQLLRQHAEGPQHPAALLPALRAATRR